MKKKIFGGIAIFTIAAIAAINVTLSTKNNHLPAISLANVEALAQEINGWDCFTAGCYFHYDYDCYVFGGRILYCPYMWGISPTI
jgi:hypothetical protein